jgi:cob(I)alamin adenosyltransferase
VKIYTRTGDDGTTGLLGAGRVPKSDPRVEAFGGVDELNAAIGAARAADRQRWLEPDLATVQARLFQIGAELAASDPSAVPGLERVSDDDVIAIEHWIDRCEADLPPLKRFILPGGSDLGAALHLARTACRSAERRVVALAAAHAVRGEITRYLNRLADLLFVLARWCNRRSGVNETEWPPAGGP